MRVILGLLGLVLLLGGVATAGLVARAFAVGPPPQSPLGQLWYDTHRASLNLVQVSLERHLWPPLWQDGVFPVLQQPAPVVMGVALVLGLILLLLARRRGPGTTGNGKRRLFSSR